MANELRRKGIEVWYDEFSIQPGDSFIESVEKGLRGSLYGILIISKNFFKKNWVKLEFETLLYKAVTQKKKLFQVWHNVTVADVEAYSLFLATTQAFKSEIGVEQLADELLVLIRGLSLANKQEKTTLSYPPNYLQQVYKLVNSQETTSPSELKKVRNWRGFIPFQMVIS